VKKELDTVEENLYARKDIYLNALSAKRGVRMSDYPPYDGGSNPYMPPTQYPPQYPPSEPYQYQAYAQPVYPAPQPYAVGVTLVDPGSGQALAGMILGIIGLILPFLGLVPLLGLIFSILGLKSTLRKGMAVAGLIMSILGLVFTIFSCVFIFALLSHSGSTY
jgi:hypothetical protein